MILCTTTIRSTTNSLLPRKPTSPVQPSSTSAAAPRLTTPQTNHGASGQRFLGGGSSAFCRGWTRLSRKRLRLTAREFARAHPSPARKEVIYGYAN